MPRHMHQLPMDYRRHLQRGLEHTRNHVCLTARHRQLSRMCRPRRQRRTPRSSTSLLIRLAFHRPRFVPKVIQRWKWTKIHVLGRVHPKRGIVRHVSARRSVLETESTIVKGIENATETETEIGSRGEMGQGAVVVRVAEIAGSISHMRVEIGRWQKEWDFDFFFFRFFSQFCILDGTPA